MAEFNLGLLADNAHIDPSGKLYVLGEFRYIFSAQLPVQYPHFTVVLRWLAEIVEVRDQQNTIEIEIIDEDGKVIAPKSPKIPIQFGEVGPAARGRAQAQMVLNMNGLVLPHYGDYAIHFFLNGVSCGKVVFYVMQLPSASAPPNVGR